MLVNDELESSQEILDMTHKDQFDDFLKSGKQGINTLLSIKTL
jgi:hypothetical protein